MPRRNTSTQSDEEIYAALRQLVAKLGHIPSEPDINAAKEFPLNASGLRRRYHSLHRALLFAGIWFRQPHGVPIEPLTLEDLPIPVLWTLMSDPEWQTLHLNGIASTEEVLRERFELGQPVGGMFSLPIEGKPLFQVAQYAMWMRGVTLLPLDATASARAFEVTGHLVLEDGRPYLSEVPAFMVLIYNLGERGWVYDGRLVIPATVDLGHYVLAGATPVRA